MGVPKYRNGFEVTLHPETLSIPLRWKKPRVIFVNSMSDLFHEKIPFFFVQQVFTIMGWASHHVFQVLTKRSRNLCRLEPQLTWPDNVWMGVTVESGRYRYRIDDLRGTRARVKFLSLEPLIGPPGRLDLKGIDWVVVGGESGPGARPMRREWVLDVRQQCRGQGVAFFFKQWGGVNKKQAGRLLEGRTWQEMPSLDVSGEPAGQISLF
jgi:protein gp37